MNEKLESSQNLIDILEIDCYMYYVEDLLKLKEEKIGNEVIEHVKYFGDMFYKIADTLKIEQTKREKK